MQSKFRSPILKKSEVKVSLSYIYNVRFVVSRSLNNEVSLFFQIISLILFYMYERQLLFEIFGVETNGTYFIHSSLMSNVFIFFGLICLSFYLRMNKVKPLLSLYFSTFIPCQLWTWIIFSIYLIITIPVNFLLVENNFVDLGEYFSGFGYFLFNSLPFLLLIFFLKKELSSRENLSNVSD
jgi:hypothetical protein